MNSKGLLSYYKQEKCVAALHAIDWLFINSWPFILITPIGVLNMLHMNKMDQISKMIVSEKVNLQI